MKNKTSNNCIELITRFEGMILKPYLCPANVPTIGIGSTYYEDGSKVSMSDKPITTERAKQLLKNTLLSYEDGVNSNVKTHINQNQFDALVSFCYNVGIANFKSSTLLRYVNNNPDNPKIAIEFSRWNKGGGKILKGLVNRRKAEAELYFKK